MLLIHKVKTENYYGKERNNAVESGKKKLRGTQQRQTQASGNFGTMIPRDLFDEINAFLKERNMTKVDFIRTAYEIMKSENNGTHN